MRVRIKQLPKQSMAYGGRVFNQVAPNALPDRTSEPDHKVKKTLQPVSREEANIEAEKGETAFILNEDGLPAHYKIGGNRHSRGGTPLNVPEDTFIFSDTKSMTIKDLKVLKFFGETKPKTPAKIAEKYDMNQYRKVLSDNTTDTIQKQTAEKMIENYTMILGKLALVQESMKGFPQGIPMIAQPYMTMNNISPEMILPQPPEQVQQQMQSEEGEMPQQEMSEPMGTESMEGEMAPPMEQAPPMGMAYGGYAYGGYSNPFSYNPLSKYVYASGGSTKRRVRIKALPGSLHRMDLGGQPGPISGSVIAEDLGNNKVILQVKDTYYIYDMATGASGPESNSAENAKRVYLGQDPIGGVKTTTNTGNTGNTSNTGNTGNTGNTNKGTSTSGSTGRGGRMDYMKYNQDMWDEYSKLAEEGKILPDVPQINFESEEDRKRNTVQGERPGNPNVYGDRDWNKGQEFEDFKRRQKWFFDQNPNFNPNNRADVAKFQNEYCKRAAQFGMKNCHFLSKGPSGTGYDGKFGEHTWSAPGFNEAPVKQEQPKLTIPPAENKPQPPIQTVPLEQPVIPNRGLEFYPQDLANMFGVIAQRIPRPKTWNAPLLFNAPDVAYITPDYSPIMEAANISTQGINAYGSRQSADASLSAIQGKGARQAADHNLQVANMNAGIYNQWQQAVSNTVNANMQYNAAQKQMTFDATEAYKADVIKAKNKKLADMINMGNTALTNAVETYNLNQLYPHYQISPGTGGTAYFNRGEALKAQQNANYSKKLQEYKMWKEAYPGMDDDTIAKFMAAKDSGVYSTTPGYTNPMDVPGGYTGT